jgi:urea transport system substrate-binding protein
MSSSRRQFSKSLSAVALGVAALGLPLMAQAEETIKVGVLHSLSGTMASSETVLKDVALMAIDEINAKGGVMGKKLQPVVVDPASNWPLFAEKAKQLITQDKVAVMFGCWTSVSRKSVLPVVEELNGLLFYPVQPAGGCTTTLWQMPGPSGYRLCKIRSGPLCRSWTTVRSPSRR